MRTKINLYIFQGLCYSRPMFFSKQYRISHCKAILQKIYSGFKKHSNQLSEQAQFDLKERMLALQSAIDKNDKPEASRLAHELEAAGKTLPHTPRLLRWIESILALGLALLAAIVIRQMWFELYEIPTGSMRPTFKEQDLLTVSKTQFGINVPLATSHFYFDPALVERTGTLIFSGEGLPLLDNDTTFLGIFPYKKRYVKRLLGKPGDLITFYGGQLYGMDDQGRPLDILRTSSWMAPLEHIPFLGFEGQPRRVGSDLIFLDYFQIPLGKITLLPGGKIKGEVFNGKEWIADKLDAARTPHDTVQTLSDHFGMRHFAMTQLLKKEELSKDNSLKPLKLPEAPYYLLLKHTPNLDFTKSFSKTFPNLLTTAIPLFDEDLKKLAASLYTARFVVEEGYARRYSLDDRKPSGGAPALPGVPDGTYEFYHGKAYAVGMGGITTELEADHPLYQPKLLPTLYNFGMHWDKKGQPIRYAYFREGDLYLMGAPLLKKEEEKLKAFVEQEKSREAASIDYVAFVDKGPPEMTLQALTPFAIKIPDTHYLVLGDNHAMSGDSRVFGFVPEDNLQGVPEFIFWPPGNRFGRPAQEPYPTFVPPRLAIWAVAAVCGILYYAVRTRRLNRRVLIP